jgi:hypothetical protein
MGRQQKHTPAVDITALQRVGITVTDDERALIDADLSTGGDVLYVRDRHGDFGADGDVMLAAYRAARSAEYRHAKTEAAMIRDIERSTRLRIAARRADPRSVA